jgi:hypothetical protein
VGGLGPSPMSSGGGGFGGLGPASGLSATPAGVGAQAAGLSSLARGGSAAAVQTDQIGSPATGFGQGVSLGSSAGSAMPLYAATGIGTPAAGIASAAPAAGMSGSGGVAPAGSVAAGAQAVAATSGTGSSGVSSAAPASIMVPAPGMGAPVAAGAGASVMSPAGSATSSSGSMGSAGASPSGARSTEAVLMPANTSARSLSRTFRRRALTRPDQEFSATDWERRWSLTTPKVPWNDSV